MSTVPHLHALSRHSTSRHSTVSAAYPPELPFPTPRRAPRFKVKARKLDHPFLWALLFTASAEDITVWISATSVRASWTGYRVHTTLTVSGLVGSAADLLTFDGTIRPVGTVGYRRALAVQICASCVGLQLPS